jgi:hypothetical protein
LCKYFSKTCIFEETFFEETFFTKKCNQMFDEKDIETIAEQLGFGYEVYIHKKTRKILCVPNFELRDYDDENVIELEKHEKEYIQFPKWTSRDSYYFMEEFVKQVKDAKLKEALENALSGNKPFKSFKAVLERRKDRADLNAWHEFEEEIEKDYVAAELNIIEKML